MMIGLVVWIVAIVALVFAVRAWNRAKPGSTEAAPAPIPGAKIDREGTWCPHCGNRDSSKETKDGCFYWILVVLFFALPLLFYPFLPRVWKCRVCRNEWRA